MIHPKYDREFVNKALTLIQSFLERTLKGENKVIHFKPPKELRESINFNINDEPST